MNTETTTPTATPFEHLIKRAQDAYNNTSFSPEKRGLQLILDSERELRKDLLQLPAESHARYTAGYERHLSAWISSKANTYSVMITGGSGFNNAHHEKRNRWARSAAERLDSYRRRAMKAILRADRPVKTIDSELEQARKKLATREEAHAYMKRINAAHKKYIKSPDSFDFEGYTEKERTEIASYVPAYSWTPHPYAPFSLTNNNAEIKRLKDRVAVLESKEAKAEAAPTQIALKGEGWEVVQNNELDRIQILFAGKPDDATRTMLKKHGFKWAPSQSAWQRQLTRNAIDSLGYVVRQLPASIG